MVDESFDILNKVAQGNYTKWSIVYDITAKKIWFKTERFKQLRSVSFSSFDFSCQNTFQAYRYKWITERGDIASLLANSQMQTNKHILEKSARQSSSQVAVSQASK